MAVHNAAYIQRAFRGRNDDGSETAATWIAAENTDWTQQGNGLFRVRFGVRQDTGNADTNLAKQFKLKFSHNGGAFVDVGAQAATGIAVRYGDSTHVANGDPTTEQLLIGDTFVTGEVVEVAPSETINFPAGTRSLTEVEAVVEIVAAEVAQDDTIVLRVYESNDTALSTYEQFPTITIGTAAAPAEGAGSVHAVGSLVGAGQAPGVVPSGSGSVRANGSLAGAGHTDRSGSGTVHAVGSLAGTGAASDVGYHVFRRTPQTGAVFDPGVDTPIAITDDLSYRDVAPDPDDYDYQVFYFDGAVFSSGSTVEQITVPVSDSAAGSGQVKAEGSLTGAGSTGRSGSGSVHAAGTLTGAGHTSKAGSGSVHAAGSLAGAGHTGRSGSGSVHAEGSLAGAGQAPLLEAQGAGSVRAEGSLSGAGEVARSGSGSVHATGSLSGQGAAAEVPAARGGGSVHATGSLSADGRTTRAGAGSVHVAGSLESAGRTARSGSGSVHAAGSLQGAGPPFGEVPGASGFTDSTLGPDRFDAQDPLARLFGAASQPRIFAEAATPERFDAAAPLVRVFRETSQPRIYAEADQPREVARSVQPNRFITITYVHMEDDVALVLEPVIFAPLTRNAVPRRLWIQAREKLPTEGESTVIVDLFGDSWTGKAVIQPPGEASPIGPRDLTIPDPSTLATLEPAVFGGDPAVIDPGPGWSYFTFADGDLAELSPSAPDGDPEIWTLDDLDGHYQLQAAYRNQAGDVLEKATSVVVPLVYDGPAGDLTLANWSA